MVTITAAGREVLGRGSTVHAQTISELLLDRLTADEQDLLARALTRVAEGQPGSASRSPCRRGRSNRFRELSDRAGGLMAQPAAFGLNVDPNAGGLAIAGRIAAIADSAGLEYVGIQDHPYNPEFLDTLTVITWLAARTSRVHLFPNVANLPLRPPAMLAKQAASIDVLSGGRFELGLGAGASAEGIAGMGGPRRTPGQARAALSEAIDIIRASWAGEPFSFEGTDYQAREVRPGPRPAHPIGLWLGVVGPRAVALVGAKADGWSVSAPYVPPERLPELNDIITGAALEENRDPERITRLYNVMGLISAEDRGPFHGPAGRWIETLASLYADYQMNAFVFWPSGDRERQSRIWAEEVVPAAREALGDPAGA